MRLDNEITPRVVANFSKHVPSGSADECWVWDGQISEYGYGRFSIRRHDGKIQPYAAHRVSYTIHVGPIGEGLCIMHKCDNRACVNPAHLRAATQAENVKDRRSKGRPGSRNLRGLVRLLNASAVIAIRSSRLSDIELAKKYNVHRLTINAARHGRSWATIKSS